MSKFISKLQKKKKLKICKVLRENTKKEIFFLKKYFKQNKSCIFY